MRSFTEILNEARTIYPFKIGVAGKLPEGFADQLENALKKFGVSSLSSGKTTPIQERPLDFPQLQNMEVTYFDAELVYPTTPQVLTGYIANISSVPEACVMVRRADEPLMRYQEGMPVDESEVEPYQALLDTEDMGGTSAQQDVAQNRVMELLKELEQARKEREHDPAAAAPVGKSEDISDKQNTKSPIGS